MTNPPEEIAPTVAQLAAVLNDIVNAGNGHYTWTADVEVIEIIDDNNDYHRVIYPSM